MRAIITKGDGRVIYVRQLTCVNIYDKDGVNIFLFSYQDPHEDVKSDSEKCIVLFEHEVAKVEVLP